MLESFSFKLSTDCCACRISLPLNGIVPTVRCYHCGEVNELDRRFWTDAISGGLFNLAFERAMGETLEALNIGKRVEFGRSKPRCHRCEGPEVDLASLEAAVDRRACACTSCGASISVRRADELCLAINSGARFVVNELAPGAEGQELQARRKPIVFQCLSCGGSLEVDGSSRLVTCKYCNTDNYLPDGLWQMLRPVPKPEPFFLVCEYENEEERALRAERETPEELARLATDASPLVRRAVAAHPATPHGALEKLAFDANREVLRALASNTALPAYIVDEMARSDDPEFQVLAARHPSLSLKKLRHLARCSSGAARDIAALRLSQLDPSAMRFENDDDDDSVIEDVKGFFAKLFGG